MTEPFFKRAAAESYAAGDPTGWFERVYAAAEAGEAIVPWDHRQAEPLLVSWARARRLDGHGKRALVVGCGLGDDAEFLASLGFSVTAFDIAPTAIEAARQRWPESAVTYTQADLFAAPQEWRHAFDFVLEHATIQALPATIRPEAIRAIAEFPRPGGTVLVIARARDDAEPARELPPFTLLRQEIESFGPGTVERVDDNIWLGEFTF